MRKIGWFLVGVVAMFVIVGYSFVYRPLPVPDVALGIDQQCIEAMRRPPDLTWTAPGHRDSGARPPGIPYNQVSLHNGRQVRVAGVLHAESDALYRSRDHMKALAGSDWPVDLLVALGTLWPGEPWMLTKSPYISDRCAVVEGVAGAGSGGADALYDVTRLEVWSVPHRPFVWPPPPLPPTAAAQAARRSRARWLNDIRARLGTDGPRRTLAAVMANDGDRDAFVKAVAAGEPEGLDVAVALLQVADAPAHSVLRQGIQEAMGTNTLGVVCLVAEETFDVRDACRTDAIPPGIDTVRSTVDAVGRIDLRIAHLLDVDDANLAVVTQRCIDELRRERDEVLARAASGSEPWRPRPGR